MGAVPYVAGSDRPAAAALPYAGKTARITHARAARQWLALAAAHVLLYAAFVGVVTLAFSPLS